MAKLLTENPARGKFLSPPARIKITKTFITGTDEQEGIPKTPAIFTFPLRPKSSYAISVKKTRSIVLSNFSKPAAAPEEMNEDATWHRVMNTIDTHPKDSMNYFECLPIKPGIDFYQSLLKYKKYIKDLRLLFVETLFSIGDCNYLLFTDKSTGVSQIKENVDIKKDFYENIILSENQMTPINILSDSELECIPGLYLKRPAKFPIDPCQTHAEIHSIATMKSKLPMICLKTHNIFQTFTFKTPKKKQGFVRMTYYPKQQFSEGHFVSNILASFNQFPKIEDKLLKYFILPYEKGGSLKYYHKAAQPLGEYEHEAKKLYKFLLYNVGLRIKNLTIDFIRLENNQLAFFDLKSFELVEDDYLILKSISLTDKREQIYKRRKLLEEATKTILCNMCNINFAKEDASMKVTKQTVLMVKNHLERRGLNLFPEMNQGSEEMMNHSVIICKQCYSLIVAEYSLIEVECRFAQIQGIDIDIQKYTNCFIKKLKWSAVTPSDNKLYQWRIMIYLQDLDGIGEIIYPNFKKDNNNYYIMYKMFNTVIKYPMIWNKPKTPKRSLSPNKKFSNIINLCNLRTLYFFSVSLHLEQFFNNEMMEIRICSNSDWNQAIASGTVNILSQTCCTNYLESCVQYAKSIILFNHQNMGITAQLHMKVGVMRSQQKCESTLIPLMTYHEIYLPMDIYITSEVYPREWMETIVSPNALNELNDDEDLMTNREDHYSSYAQIMTEKEMGLLLTETQETEDKGKKYKVRPATSKVQTIQIKSFNNYTPKRVSTALPHRKFYETVDAPHALPYNLMQYLDGLKQMKRKKKKKKLHKLTLLSPKFKNPYAMKVAIPTQAASQKLLWKVGPKKKHNKNKKFPKINSLTSVGFSSATNRTAQSIHKIYEQIQGLLIIRKRGKYGN